MKKLSICTWKIWGILFLGGMLVIPITKCTKDFSFEEIKHELQLLPKYQEGEFLDYKTLINNDSIEILIPGSWNGSFIVYAHGYVDPTKPIYLPNDVIGGIALKELILGGNYGYASTSYSENGFAVKEAVVDIRDLGNILKAIYKPKKIYLGGVSEGGLIALRALEGKQRTFDAGLTACGPVGDFNRQLQYFGDFHVLFRYFYEKELNSMGIDIGSPSYVSPALMQAWSNGDLDAPLLTILSAEPLKLIALMEIANVPVVEGMSRNDSLQLVRDILRFNIMATNDMIERVNGIPFDNSSRLYEGDLSFAFDFSHLNNNVLRISGDEQAFYCANKLLETSGSPSVPIVIMHTEGDHITPIWHMEEYKNKVDPNRTDILFFPYPLAGHCSFNIDQINAGIGSMVTLSYVE